MVLSFSRSPRPDDGSSSDELISIQGDKLHAELLRESDIDRVAAPDLLIGSDLCGSGRQGLGHREQLDPAAREQDLDRVVGQRRLSEPPAESSGHFRYEDDGSDDPLISLPRFSKPGPTRYVLDLAAVEKGGTDAGVHDRHL